MPDVRKIGPDTYEVIGIALSTFGVPVKSVAVNTTDLLTNLPAAIYSDPYLTNQISVLFANNSGIYRFFVAPGRYRISYPASGLRPVEDLDLGNPFSRVPDDDLAVFAKEGTLAVAAGKTRFRFPFAARILGVSAAVDTAPTGAAVIVDVNKNGTTLYTTQANRPAIAAGQTAASETVPDVTAVVAGDELKVDIDQIGSSAAGADLSVFVRYVRE
jgi:hypothetical protein